jgi:hypothetical protein
MIKSPLRYSLDGSKILLIQKCVIECDCCATEYHLDYNKIINYQNIYFRDLCRKCRCKEITATGKLKGKPSKSKGKTYEELYGAELAKIKKQKVSDGACRGEKNHMYRSGKWGGKNEKYNAHLAAWKGKKFEEIFGHEKAKEIRKKLSVKSSGKNNPMYGKPSPVGSGNGWSGWYKNIYFRSILELSYLKHLIDSRISFENGEYKKYQIPYKAFGVDRTYSPDFYLVETDEYIDVKPKKLVNSRSNKLKFEAAKNKHGDKFRILTEDEIVRLETPDIIKLLLSGDLKFIKRYEEKLKEKYEQCNRLFQNKQIDS